jgi:hypothetical protein
MSAAQASWPWIALLALGAYHGVNPGMGWLFAVALGLQEKRRRAVLQAIPPLVLGHLISVGAIVALVVTLEAALPISLLRIVAAIVLIGFGLSRLLRARHPRWVGMQVGFRDLTLWSFLMASGHGAGLMLVPIILAWPANPSAAHMTSGGMTHSMPLPAGFHGPALAKPTLWLLAVGIHTFAYLAVMALVASLVYAKFGVAILRRAWLNLDLIWAIVLIATGVLALFL